MYLNILRQIRKLSDQHYGNGKYEHEKFLSGCLDIHLREFGLLGNKFILLTLTIFPKGKLVTIDSIKNEKWSININLEVEGIQDIKKLIEKYFDEIGEKKVISMTELLLSNKKAKDFYLTYNNTCNDYDDTIIDKNFIFQFKLDKLEYFDGDNYESFINKQSNKIKIEEFINEFQEMETSKSLEEKINLYGKYIYNYLQISHLYSNKNNCKPFLLHFIKPSIVEFEYNVLLSIATSELLKSEELAFINLILHRIVSQTATEKVEEVKLQATRAAISQVLARNMSHNIGSHVLSRLDKEKIKKIYDPCSTSPDFWMRYYKPLDIKNNKSQTGLDLLAHFNSYQKARMDFLADVTFGEPTLETTKNFYQEVIGGIDKNYILMDNISGTNYNYQIVVRNLIENKESFGKACPENCQYVINETMGNDVPVSIPNDVLGCHAFYLIIENLIRNCAKHGGTTGEQKIHIDITNSELDNYYEVLVYDSSKKAYDGKDKSLLSNQNNKINEDVLDKNSKLRQGGWGLIEMETGAAYLRKVPIEKANDDEFAIDPDDENSCYPKGKTKKDGTPNLLKAVKVGDEYFGYRLFLMKPKELLVVFSKEQFENNGIKEQIYTLRKVGITIKVIDADNENKFADRIVYAYPIMLFVGSKADYDKHILPYANKLPSRKLVCLNSVDTTFENSRFAHSLSETDTASLLKEQPVELLNTLWSLWLDKVLGYLGINIHIHSIDSDINSTKNNICTVLKEPLKNKFNYNNGKKSIVFSDHALNEAQKIVKNCKEQAFYAEPYNSKDYFLLKKVLKNDIKGFEQEIKNENLPLWIKLLESAATTVFVVDERIQELAEAAIYTDEETKESMQYIDLLYATNVMIPRYPNGDNVKSKSKRNHGDDKRINLNQSDFSSEYNEIICYLQLVVKKKMDGVIENKRIKADFLLIHLGILEKLIKVSNTQNNEKSYDKDKPEGIEQFIKEQILQITDGSSETLNDVQTKIIVISGRGKPSNMPKEYLYLNYSIVAQYCIENRLKLLLNDIVHSSKPL